ncbi:hypothetical protein [Gelidibacter mesophilus]|uniref:hypothetical protein n=1 Tax=Gelidibacter mesophilus TaxID=169050 RepID=UPI00041F1332|nr:hypothetical protein [Gelidibacter mesophilus]
MIVNPQFFNYRIIIGSLIVSIAVLGVVGFNTYQSNKAEQHFLEQEKKLVESELSQMILRYDELNQSGDILSAQLDSAKKNTSLALDQLRLMESDFSVFTRFKSELAVIKSKNNALFETVDSINTSNEHLQKDNRLAYIELDRQKEINNSLLKINASLKRNLEEGALLTANSFNAKAYKSGNNAATTKASHANRIDVCFTLAENVLAEKGRKDIYIQILNPLNNVIANKGAVEFGKFLLLYSDRQVINYNNKVVDVCTTVRADSRDQPFAKGTYYVSVFHNERKLGSTQIELN